MSIRVVAGSAQAVVANDGHAWALRGNKFSIMWWDRIPIAAGITRAFQHATSAGTNRFIVGRGGGVIYLGVLWSAAADFNVTSGLADDGEWHCTQVVYDAGSTANVPTVYFDGVPQSVTVANAPTGSLPTPAVTDVGTYGNRHSLAGALGGNLAHVAMWGNYLLSFDEVLATYLKGPLALNKKPTLYRPFDPSLPGGILRALGTADGQHLNPKGAHVYPFADANDPYGGRYVGGRRYRSVTRTLYRPIAGTVSSAAIAASLSTSFSLSSNISVDKPVASSLSVMFSTTQDVSIAKALSSALSVVFSTTSGIGVAKPLSSALSVVFSTSSALVGGAAAIASSLSSTFTLSSAVSVSKLVSAALQTTFATVSSITVPKPVAAAMSVIFSAVSQISVASGGGLGLVEATLIWIARVAADVVHRTAQQSTIVHAPQVETTVKSETSVHVTITDRTDG